MNISSLSTEYVSIPMTTPVASMHDAVQVAFTAFGADPVNADWHTAAWETDAGVDNIIVEIGPASSIPLAKGYYWIWFKITDNPEIPVDHVGTLIVE